MKERKKVNKKYSPEFKISVITEFESIGKLLDFFNCISVNNPRPTG